MSIKEIDFKIWITGEYYNAINQGNFEKLIKPGAAIDVYMLKPKYQGIFEKLNDNLGIKDAATVICSGIEVLDLKSIQHNLRHLYAMNLILGILALALSAKIIYNSIQGND